MIAPVMTPNSSSANIPWRGEELGAIWGENNAQKLFIFLSSGFLENDPGSIAAF